MTAATWGPLDGLRELVGPRGEPLGAPVYPRAPVVQDTNLGIFNSLMGMALQAPVQEVSDYGVMRLDQNALSKMTPSKFMEVLIRLSPDMSRARWNFLRLCNPGWEYDVFRPGTERRDQEGYDWFRGWESHLKGLHGSIDVPVARMFGAGWQRGGLLSEMLMTADARAPYDWDFPDPSLVQFRPVRDPIYGIKRQLTQRLPNGRWNDITSPLVVYLPIDPMPGNAYGEPMALPALVPSATKLATMDGVRRWVQQQGYPRIDLEIDSERIQALMKPTDRNNPAKFFAWARQARDEVQKEWGALQPEDGYVHLDIVKLAKAIGAVDSNTMGGIKAIFDQIQGDQGRGLKTQPIMMGINEAVSETHANRQWEIEAAGVKSVQHLGESILERQGALALRSQGIIASVRWRFHELRASELFRDAQVQELVNRNSMFQYLAGWVDHNTAARLATNHNAAAPEPLAMPQGFSALGGPQNPSAVNPEPGASRALSDRLFAVYHPDRLRPLADAWPETAPGPWVVLATSADPAERSRALAIPEEEAAQIIALESTVARSFLSLAASIGRPRDAAGPPGPGGRAPAPTVAPGVPVPVGAAPIPPPNGHVPPAPQEGGDA
jgi:hypothetical protein